MQKKLKEIKPGEIFKFGGYEWIKLEEEGLCLMKDILEERAFDEDSNDWRKSELREYLNNDFYKTLTENGADEKDFLMIETDLTADDGMKDYGTSKDRISFMTADLYRSNRHLLKPLGNWWWLATPHSCLTSSSYTIRVVSSSGPLYYNNAYTGHIGVRPLCNLSSETLVSVPGEEKEDETGEINTTELIKKWGEENNLTHRTYDQHIYRLIRKIGGLTKHIEENDYNEAKQDLGYIYAALVILAKKLSGTGNEDYTSFLIDEIEAGHNIW